MVMDPAEIRSRAVGLVEPEERATPVGDCDSDRPVSTAAHAHGNVNPSPDAPWYCAVSTEAKATGTDDPAAPSSRTAAHSSSSHAFLEAEVVRLRRENQRLAEALRDLVPRIVAAMAVEIETLRDRSETLANRVTETQARMDRQRQETAEVAALSRRLLDSINRQREEFQRDRQELADQLAIREREVAGLRKLVAERDAELAALSGLVEAFRSERESLTHRLNQLRRDPAGVAPPPRPTRAVRATPPSPARPDPQGRLRPQSHATPRTPRPSPSPIPSPHPAP